MPGAWGVGRSALQMQRLEDVKSRGWCLSPEKPMSSPRDREREEPKSQGRIHRNPTVYGPCSEDCRSGEACPLPLPAWR